MLGYEDAFMASDWIWALFAFIGLGVFSGFLAGLLGIGGGIILVPGLHAVFKFLYGPSDALMHVSVATSLAIIILTGLSSARAHAQRGALDDLMLTRMAGGVLCGVTAGSLVAGFLPGEALKGIFAIFALALATVIVFDIRMAKLGAGEFLKLHQLPMRWQNHVPPVLIGLISSLVGIGGATLSVPAMTEMKLPIHRAIGTASALGLVIAVPAALTYIALGWDAAGRPPYSLGYVNVLAWVCVAPVSALIAPLGAAAAHHLKAFPLRLIFSGFLVLVALRMAWQALGL